MGNSMKKMPLPHSYVAEAESYSQWPEETRYPSAVSIGFVKEHTLEMRQFPSVVGRLSCWHYPLVC